VNHGVGINDKETQGSRSTDLFRAPEVRLTGITRSFGPMIANDSIDLHLKPASIHALVGENGAGKSTLMRILFGLLKPDSGQIQIDGKPVVIESPAHALAHGIGMIHQHFMLVQPMTVLENIALGSDSHTGLSAIPRRALTAELRKLFADYQFELDPEEKVENLSVGGQQRVEISRLLFRGARLLICDEPTAVLAPPEVDAFFKILTRFRDEGRTVVFITHKLAEVLAIADEVTVLRHGRVIGNADRSSLSKGQLVEWIMGDTSETPADDKSPDAESTAKPTRQNQTEDVILSVDSLSAVDSNGRLALDALSLQLRAGEIIGIAGVAGNGQKELSEVISGRRGFKSGTLKILDHLYRPGDSMRHSNRPALIPEDRSHEGLISDFSLWENLLLSHAAELQFIKPWWFSHRQVKQWAMPVLKQFRVEPPNPQHVSGALSGGNQQKVLCAREMTIGRRILIACQPTRGIDIASTEFLHQMLRDYAISGGGVILISADLDEILSLSDRVGTIYRGRLGQLKPTGELDLATIGRSMVGLTESDPVTSDNGQ